MNDAKAIMAGLLGFFVVLLSVAVLDTVDKYNKQEAIIEQTRILADVLKEAAKQSPEAAAKAKDQIGELIRQLEKEK